MKKLACLLGLLAAIGAAHAAPLERDLGLGLVYWRLHALPEDLPANGAAGHRPCVLDLRYARGNAAAAADLLAWLKSHAGPKTPVFLLANTATSAALLAPLDSPDAVVGLVILGPVAPRFAPDIALAVSPATERRAYEALEHGTPVESLLAGNPDKPRFDEERLAREHLSDSAIDDDADDEPPAASSPPSPPPPLIDVVLQRAVQLHRTLVALKRL